MHAKVDICELYSATKTQLCTIGSPKKWVLRLYLTHLWSDFKKSGMVPLNSANFSASDRIEKNNFWNPKLFGFGVPHLGSLSWGVESPKRHHNLSAIDWCCLRALQLFGVGCTQITGGSPDFDRSTKLGMLSVGRASPVCQACLARLSGCVGECISLAEVCTLWASRCQISKNKMLQIWFRLGLRPRPSWGNLQYSPDPLAGFKVPTSKGREGREGNGRGVKGSFPGPAMSARGPWKVINNFLLYLYDTDKNFGPDLALLFTLHEIWSFDSQQNH